MTKRSAIRSFIIMSIVAVLLAVLCFVSFTIPGSNSKFAGFANAIQTDIDLKGGFAGEYEISFNEKTIKGTESLNQTTQFIKTKLNEYGYNSATVQTSGVDSMRIEIPDALYAKDFLRAVGTEGELVIRTSEISEESPVSDADIQGKEIKDIYSTYAQIGPAEFTWGTTIEFTDEGKEKITNLTASENGTIYIYVGEEIFSRISFNQKQTSNTLFVYGSSQDRESANIYAFTMLMGTYGVDFDLKGDEIASIAPTYGNGALLGAGIAIIILLVAFSLATILMFGEFGYLITLSLVFFGVLVIFFMQAIPIFTLSMSGIIGSVFGLALLFASYCIIFGNIKKGYAEGKKIPLAVRAGYKKSIMPVVDINVIALILAVVAYFAGGFVLQSFALALGICSALNLFVSLLLTRWLTKWYLRINSTKADKLHMKREASVDEL